MDIRKIKKLIDLMIESDLQAIEVKEGDQSIALTRRNPVVAAAGAGKVLGRTAAQNIVDIVRRAELFQVFHYAVYFVV